MNKEKFYTQFPIGSHLCRKPMPPMSEMKRDIEILKSHGFNLIKIQAHWGLDENAEGVIDTAAYDELITHAAKFDMGVYLGFTNEQAPNWLWEKYPDCRMVGRNGVPVAYQAQYTLPGDGKPGPCYDHPGAMEAQLDFTARFVVKLGVHENIVIWNTWQEISYWAESFAGQHVCYCDNTLEFFRTWLKGKYGDLDNLNRALSVNYSDWKYVMPDRVNGTSCLPMDYEWSYFMNHIQIGNVLKKRCEVIKAHDIHNRPVFAHKGSPAFASSADYTYARCQDFLGSSSYPAWGSGDGRDDRKYDAHGIISTPEVTVNVNSRAAQGTRLRLLSTNHINSLAKILFLHSGDVIHLKVTHGTVMLQHGYVNAFLDIVFIGNRARDRDRD